VQLAAGDGAGWRLAAGRVAAHRVGLQEAGSRSAGYNDVRLGCLGGHWLGPGTRSLRWADWGLGWAGKI
jgi:hypothetical protein